jgi:hypothetical protein
MNEAWKRAVLNKDLEEIANLCIEETCDRSAIKQRDFNDLDTSLTLSIQFFVSMLRIQFLVQECGLVPNSSTLEYATRYYYWAAVNYFHNELGLRYTSRFYCRAYLRHLEVFANQERAVQLVLQYLPWFTKLSNKQSYHHNITNIAYFRHKRAQSAQCGAPLFEKEATRLG